MSPWFAGAFVSCMGNTRTVGSLTEYARLFLQDARPQVVGNAMFFCLATGRLVLFQVTDLTRDVCLGASIATLLLPSSSPSCDSQVFNLVLPDGFLAQRFCWAGWALSDQAWTHPFCPPGEFVVVGRDEPNCPCGRG